MKNCYVLLCLFLTMIGHCECVGSLVEIVETVIRRQCRNPLGCFPANSICYPSKDFCKLCEMFFSSLGPFCFEVDNLS